jgi:hypothetical protein
LKFICYKICLKILNDEQIFKLSYTLKESLE